MTMILIFHGDNPEASLTAVDSYINAKPNPLIYRFDHKDIDYFNLNLILNSTSLLGEDNKIVILTNFFSCSKPVFDKISTLLKNSTCEIVIWQDKLLTATQLKPFSQAKVNTYKADNHLYLCLNSVLPKNIKAFATNYQKMLKQNMFDLFLYMLKGNFRRQLSTYSKFPQASLKTAYLQTIEMEHLYKSGQLTLPKDIALERIILNLIK